MSRCVSRNTLFILALLAGSLPLSRTSALAQDPIARGNAAQKTQPGIPGLPQPPANATEKDAKVYGQKIHYMEAGSGPTVILLHGLGGDLSNWSSTVGPLSEKYHVIVPDQIGFGRSDKPLINYRVGTLIDFLDGLYKELKINKASLVGNSLGGWTAAAFALAHPEKVERLVLVDAAGFALEKGFDPYTLNGLNPSTREGMAQVLSLITYNKQMFSNPAVIDAAFARKIAAGDGYTIQRFVDSIIHSEDVLDNRLSGIKQPTLIIWGREDGLTPMALGERFKKEILGSELLIIDKCGHVPQIEKAAEFNAALVKFLSGSHAGAEPASRQ